MTNTYVAYRCLDFEPVTACSAVRAGTSLSANLPGSHSLCGSLWFSMVFNLAPWFPWGLEVVLIIHFSELAAITLLAYCFRRLLWLLVRMQLCFSRVFRHIPRYSKCWVRCSFDIDCMPLLALRLQFQRLEMFPYKIGLFPRSKNLDGSVLV